MSFFSNLFSSKNDQKKLKDEMEKQVAKEQERLRKRIKKNTGIDVRKLVLMIGRDISWADIVNQVFRVLEFDRSDTIIDKNDQVKAKSLSRPYGYLLVESPILNQKALLPIVHKDDFFLASSVLDEPKVKYLSVDEELLVTYSPKYVLPGGFMSSPHHVLHYVITPHGTMDSYYSMDNDIHMAKPNPQKLFGQFVYDGMIQVRINRNPKL